MHPQAKQIMSAFALVAAAVAIGSTAAGARAQGFGYHGPTGPAHWGELSPAWEACRSGQAQSPVDIRSNRVATRLELAYGPTTGEILDNGHTIEVETHGHNTLTLDGTAFELVQFHFHSASEHRVGGRGHDMELHLVHRSAAGALAVIGVFLQRGASSGALGPILARLPERGEHLPLEAAFDPAALLPSSKQHFRYAGSLTTPPCSEGVQWLVLRQPMTISDEDAARLAERLRFNARAVQRALR